MAWLSTSGIRNAFQKGIGAAVAVLRSTSGPVRMSLGWLAVSLVIIGGAVTLLGIVRGDSLPSNVGLTVGVRGPAGAATPVLSFEQDPSERLWAVLRFESDKRTSFEIFVSSTLATASRGRRFDTYTSELECTATSRPEQRPELALRNLAVEKAAGRQPILLNLVGELGAEGEKQAAWLTCDVGMPPSTTGYATRRLSVHPDRRGNLPIEVDFSGGLTGADDFRVTGISSEGVENVDTSRLLKPGGGGATYYWRIAALAERREFILVLAGALLGLAAACAIEAVRPFVGKPEAPRPAPGSLERSRNRRRT